MTRIKKSFSKKEIFRAWVNQSGLTYYNSSKYYKSITGHDNVLFLGTKASVLKYPTIDESVEVVRQYSNVRILSVIDRDKKLCIIYNGEHRYSIENALDSNYKIFITDYIIKDYSILDNEELCLKSHSKYLIKRIYESFNSEFLIIDNKIKIYHKNINDLYKKNYKNYSGDIINTLYGEFYNFIKSNKINKYDWYDKPLFDYIFIYSYKGCTRENNLLKDIKSIKTIINKKLFTKAEILLLEQRSFWTNYCFNKGISFKDVQNNWNKDFDKPINWKKTIINRTIDMDIINDKIYKAYQECNIVNLNNAIKEFNILYPNFVEYWRDNKISNVNTRFVYYSKYVRNYKNKKIKKTICKYYGRASFNTIQFKLNEFGNVLASNNLTFLLEDFIKLYKLIETTLLRNNIELLDKDVTIKDFKDDNIKFRNNKLLEVCYCKIPNKEIFDFCIALSYCKLWMEDIKNFINYYKLNERFEL